MDNNASAAIMLRLPTDRLQYLRADFESEEDGLNLDMFLTSMVEHMSFDDEVEIINTIPNLIDFFRDVDINGDGHMDWGEFVQFVIAGVVREKHHNNERISHHLDVAIQPPASRQTARCCKVIPELRRMFVSIGDELLVYGIDDKSPSMLTSVYKLKMQTNFAYSHAAKAKNRGKNSSDHGGGVGSGAALTEQGAEGVQAIDFTYIPSKDILCVLRSDLSIEFMRFMSRSKMSAEIIDYLGVWPLGGVSFSKIAIRDVPKQPWKLFAVGGSKVINTWTISLTTTGTIDLEDDYSPLGECVCLYVCVYACVCVSVCCP